MLRYAPWLAGVVAGALYYRERRERRAMERLGAATLESLLDAIDANNSETGAHVRRVAEYALILATAADANERLCRSVERVALFHDIGKIDGAISDIVSEDTRLTAEERREVMRHPRRGAEVLRPISAFYPDLPEGVLSHHERWDGTGYPRGLRGESIPIEARIVAIVDTFDAITQARSYSYARTFDAATDIILEGRGTQFDPNLVDLFLSPPVLDDVRKALKRANSPRCVHSSKRRGGSAQHSIPDITFRWRSPSPLQQRAGR
jgi:HD-GYP domain-containing protein (c-di-GMP phosphodiesterase class II)